MRRVSRRFHAHSMYINPAHVLTMKHQRVACTSTPPCLRFKLVPVEAGMGAVPTKAARTRASQLHARSQTSHAHWFQSTLATVLLRRNRPTRAFVQYQTKCTRQTSSREQKGIATRAKCRAVPRGPNEERPLRSHRIIADGAQCSKQSNSDICAK